MAWAHLLAQLLEALVGRAPGGLLRAAQRGGDLAVAQVAGVAQQHGGALLGRQVAHARPDVSSSAARRRRGSATSGTSLDRDRPARPGAVVVDRLAVRDRQHPRAQVGSARSRG